ncbi:MAG: GTP-binding protein [Gulosibacter sp.]|uniref:GTP-binding protein n=1 Tax=Gulosibacter sp. TaxID=2817531 RepID=UPI003F9371BA
MNDPVDLVAVIGTCAPERHAIARSLSTQPNRWLIPAQRLSIVADPLDELLSLTPWASPPERIVAELPASVPVTHAIGALSDIESNVRLREVLCVVDASHLIPDLLREDYLAAAPLQFSRENQQFLGRAMLTVTQIEFASTIMLANWEPLSTPDLSTMMALINHLAPQARLRLHGVDAAPAQDYFKSAPQSAQQDRPGWIALLNDEFAPHMTDARVSAIRYQRIRAFHPKRLHTVLEEQIEAGMFGQVLRSSGFCSFATRPEHIAHWSHVGSMIDFSPAFSEEPPVDAETAQLTIPEETEPLAHGQDLAVIGLDLEHSALIAALDSALLTDEEFTAGPKAWRQFPDPLPQWQVGSRERE